MTTRNDLSTTRNELSTTRDELSTTRNGISTRRNELVTTRDGLSTIRKELFTTRKELFTTRKELSTTRDQLSTTRDELSTTRYDLSTTRDELSTTRYELKNVYPIIFMTQLLQPSQPRTTQRTYTTKLQRLFNSFTIDKIQHINSNECFFKLHFPQTPRLLRIIHRNDVTRNGCTIFNNDVVALDDRGSFYQLRLSIEKYDKENSQCFLVDITKSGGNRLLEYGYGGNVINWNVHRNDKGEVFFYFQKK